MDSIHKYDDLAFCWNCHDWHVKDKTRCEHSKRDWICNQELQKYYAKKRDYTIQKKGKRQGIIQVDL